MRNLFYILELLTGIVYIQKNHITSNQKLSKNMASYYNKLILFNHFK